MSDTVSLSTTKNHLLSPAIRTILLACLVAGTLDISYAIIMWGPVFGKITASQLLRNIASVLIGKSALTGGSAMTLVGLAIHYCISLVWAAAYFFLFPYLPLLARNKWVSGILYGVVVWLLMNLLVLPLVTGRAYHFAWVSFLKNIGPMLVLFGPAIALVIRRYYFSVAINPRQPE
jgi:hypothetical protein